MNSITKAGYKGLLALSLIIISFMVALCFFDWANNTLYDKKQIEDRGHQYYAQKKYIKAYADFSKAAELNTNTLGVKKKKISESYRYAATAAYANLDFIQASAMALKSLEYNNENVAAIALIKRMLKHKQITPAQIAKRDKALRTKIGSVAVSSSAVEIKR